MIRDLCRQWNMSRTEVLAAEPFGLLRDTFLVAAFDEGRAQGG